MATITSPPSRRDPDKRARQSPPGSSPSRALPGGSPKRPGALPGRPRSRRWELGGAGGAGGGHWIFRRLPELAASTVLVVAAFGQAFGRIVVDSKVELALNPGGFLSAATHLWDPSTTFGHLQNQAYGYLFPMGPFYELGYLLHFPMWGVERAWLAALFLAGFWGVVVLAEELGIGRRSTRVVAGFAYAACPFVLTVAIASAGVPPTVLLPWAILPLVRGWHGKTKPYKAVALSGLAVLGMGGVNATAVLAVLPMPFLWFATRPATRERNRMVVAWLFAVVLATAWFVVGLLFQGKYGFDFLPYTETARVTTEWTSIPEALRGAGMWMSLIAIHGIWTPAGWMYETDPIVIVATAGVAAVGLYGLARRDLPERLFLVVSLVVGTLAISAGYWGHFGSPVAHVLHLVLEGPLAPLRNVNKFQPIVTLALVLGMAHGMDKADFTKLVRALRTRASPAGVAARRSHTAKSPTMRAAAYGCVALLVGIAALPLFTGKVYAQGSFTSLPAYWRQAIDWLDAHGGHTTTLVVPGESFARFGWGTTDDQPLQNVATVPWAIRNIVPLGSTGNTMFMDAVDSVLVSGQPVPGLAAYLERAGVHYLLVENDHNPLSVSSPPPVVIRMVLAQEPGIKRIAQFGPVVTNPDAGASADINFDPLALTVGIRSLEVYQVGGKAPPPVVTTYPASHGIVLTGGPQGLLALANAGELGGLATTLAGDPLGPKFAKATWVVADTQQRRAVDFGQLYDNASYVLTAHQLAPMNAGTIGGTLPGPPSQWQVVAGSRYDTVAVLHGAKSVTSSSYGTPIARIPGYQPLGAFLAQPENAVWAAAGTNMVDPWIQVTFRHPVPVSTIGITPLDDGPWRPGVTQVKVTTSNGSRTTDVLPQAIPQAVPTAPGKTTFLRVTITRTAPAQQAGTGSGPGIAHISIPGVTITESWKLPNDGGAAAAPGAPAPTYLFSSPLPDPYYYLSQPDQEPHLSRIFDVPSASTFEVSATVAPRPGPDLMSLVAGSGGVHVSATSTFANLPLFRPQNLVSGSTLTSWWAGAGDPNPEVTMSWHGLRLLDSVRVVPDPAASRPTEIRIDTGLASRIVAVPPGGGVLHFAPLFTNHVTISFPKVKELPTFDLLTGGLIPTPVGLSQLMFPALANEPLPTLNLNAPFDLPCGKGPPLVVNGFAVPTAVQGTMQDLFSLEPMKLQTCGPVPGTLALHAGQNEVVAADNGYGMKVTSVMLKGAPLPSPAAPRSVKIDSWSSGSRTFAVGAGPAAILNLRQNYNTGWLATFDGKPLKAVRLDGWQQGWMLPPSGLPGTVHAYFAPAHAFRLSLLLGLLLALGLVAWALWPSRISPLPSRRRRARQRLRNAGKHPGHAGNGALHNGAPNGMPDPQTSEGDYERTGTRASSLTGKGGVAVVALLTLALFVLAGPLAALVPLLIALPIHQKRERFRVLGSDHDVLDLYSRRMTIPLPWVAGGAMLLAGFVIAARPGTSWNAWFGSLSYSAQLLGAVALAAVAVATLPALRARRGGEDGGVVAPPTPAGMIAPPTPAGMIAPPTPGGMIAPPTPGGMIAPPPSGSPSGSRPGSMIAPPPPVVPPFPGGGGSELSNGHGGGFVRRHPNGGGP
ncbi:MAG: alpha-(1-_3)-arabinofuranosyltransferase domain-containing protein [Acidimicrobiales bacterium]